MGKPLVRLPKPRKPPKRKPRKKLTKRELARRAAEREAKNNTPKWFPFEEARAIVHAECLPSKQAYFVWHDKYRPAMLPKAPHRTYPEFTTYNDFLGNSNVFVGRRKQRVPFMEARRWAQEIMRQRGMTTATEWLKFVKEAGDRYPDIMPKRPDLTYREFVSWRHFLGTKPEYIETLDKPEERDVPLFIVAQEVGYPNNVYRFGHSASGLPGLLQILHNRRLDIVALYEYDAENVERVWKYLEGTTNEYLGYRTYRTAFNIFQVISDIGTVLTRVPFEQDEATKPPKQE